MLIERMKQDRIDAMKFNLTIKKNLLSTLIGEATKMDKNPSDAKVISTVKSFMKNINSSIDECAKKEIELSQEANYQYAVELSLLEEYLPKQLTEGEIRAICAYVNANVIESGNKVELKYIMGHFKNNYDGQYDGALVSKIAKEYI